MQNSAATTYAILCKESHISHVGTVYLSIATRVWTPLKRVFPKVGNSPIWTTFGIICSTESGSFRFFGQMQIPQPMPQHMNQHGKIK